MAEATDLAIIDARLVDPATGRDGRGSVLIRDRAIADIVWGAAPALGEGMRCIDGRDLVLAPGLVDLRAFLGEPGAEFRETLGSGSQAAAAGGVTTIVCRPDTDPPIDDPAIIDFIKRRAATRRSSTVLPCAALTKGILGKEITEFGLLLGGRRGRVRGWREGGSQSAAHAPRHDLRTRFRRTSDEPRRRS